jgi:MFS family permease
MASLLDKSHSIAPAGYSRWLIPPAALAIHLSIGQAYAFSVFKLPLTKLIGITVSKPGEDWTQPQLFWIFSIAIAFLGASAAVFGRWVEEGGPRRAMLASACCFSSGFYISALGVHLHQLWLLYFGYGVVGGIGLGLGYISPVSTLIKWFPDRPGMSTGMAIMGFGGGAMIGSPLSTKLMAHFSSATSVGVTETFLTMGVLYFLFMMFGVFTIRIPAPDWKPAGWTPSQKQNAMITTHNVDVATATKTPQFWLLWVILCMNVTAGIGILEQASPMIQEMFKGKVGAAAAGGFVGLLSLFNMGGRFFWASLSDYIGRKATYFCFFALGCVLYILLTFTGQAHLNSIALFVATAMIIISMYGGGFATIPAYIKDLFGTLHVSAIHGRILTAWSVAGILGPLLVNYLREEQIHHNVAPANAYAVVLYLMSGLLVIGFICDLLVRPVDPKYHVASQAQPSRGFPVEPTQSSQTPWRADEGSPAVRRDAAERDAGKSHPNLGKSTEGRDASERRPNL